MKRLNKMGVVKKTTVLIISVIIVPFILLTILLYHVNQQRITNEIDAQLSQDLLSTTNSMDATLDKMESAIQSLSYQEEFVYFLNENNEISEIEQEKFKLELVSAWGNMNQMMPNVFNELVIYTQNSELFKIPDVDIMFCPLEKFPSYIGLNTKNNIRYGIPQKLYNKYDVQEMEEYNITDDVRMSIPIYYYVTNIPEEETIGILELKVYVDVLLGAGYNTMLLDRNGQIVHCSMTDLKINSDNLRGLSNNKLHTIVLENGKYRILSDVCKRTGMVRVVLKPLDNFWGTLISSLGIYTLISLNALIFTIIIIKIVVGRVLKRLVSFEQELNKMEAGKFQLVKPDLIEDEVTSIKNTFNVITIKLEEAVQDIIQKERIVKNAELRALQSQISPHFLYNTLNSIYMKLEIEEQYEIGSVIASLGELYKYTIHWKAPMVMFTEEWNHIKNYIAVMSCRLSDDFFYDLEMADEAAQFLVPKMTLQPIVENSFSSGFKESEAPWYISITAKVKNDYLEIIVENNGKCIDEEKLESLNLTLNMDNRNKSFSDTENGVGLINVMQRIHMFNGIESKIYFKNLSEKSGVSICIKIRKHNIEGEYNNEV